MPKEIERKFIVNVDYLPVSALQPSARWGITQGYLSNKPCVRVRITSMPDRLVMGHVENKAYLTVKGPGTLVRSEYEYEIPVEDAREMMKLAKGVISKTRYHVVHEGHTWELDVFHGKLKGLYVAEIELASADEAFVVPSWVTKDVTEDLRYTNVSLSEFEGGSYDIENLMGAS